MALPRVQAVADFLEAESAKAKSDRLPKGELEAKVDELYGGPFDWEAPIRHVTRHAIGETWP